jgi:type IV pilus assembly protein PilA
MFDMQKRQSQYGFGFIELLVSLAIISILITIAVTTYAEYSLRARVSGSIRLVSPAKLAVAEYYSSHNEFPASNAAAGIAPPEDISDEAVQSVSIGTVPTTGTIVVVFNSRGSVAAGDSVLLIPLKYHNTVLWQCTSKTLLKKLLPAACRGQ